MYKVVFDKKYLKDLKQIHPTYHKAIREAIKRLSEDPQHNGCIKLKGHKDLFRVRVGPYRIIYTIDDSIITIFVLELEHRKDIYRDK